MEFWNRSREISNLNEVAKRKPAQFLIVFGRRRIGKTSLLNHWIQKKNKAQGIYWVAHRNTPEILLKSFSEATGKVLGLKADFTYSSWEAALVHVFEQSRKKKVVLIIDEFTYLMDSVPEISTLIQKVWDQEKGTSKILLVICGSHFHLMHTAFLSPKQPLYGRTTASMQLEEIPPGEIGHFLPRYSPNQVVETYSVIGGVPQYLEMWNDQRPVLKNIEEQILSPVSLFRHEALYLIQDEISEPRTYLGILMALGAGLKTPATLAKETGIRINHMGKYLSTLVDLRFVRRVLSEDIENRTNTRISRYEIRDPYLRFYFEYIYRHPEWIEQERVDKFIELIRSNFDSYIGKSGYEELARRHIAALGDGNDLSFSPEFVGRAWNKKAEIDVVGIDWKSRSVILGECKWMQTKTGPDVLDRLIERGQRLDRLYDFQKHYILFSKSGFTAKLLERARSEGVILVEGAEFALKRVASVQRNHRAP